jgi:RND family efflux transporter MFP subunit
MNVGRRRLAAWLMAFFVLLLARSGFADSFECLIEPMQVVQLRSPTEGLIDQVLVERGDRVTKGQKLVELQSAVERSAVQSAHYRAQRKGRIVAAKNRLSFAKKKLERWQNLLEHKYVSPQDRDQAETEKQLAEAELQQAEEERQQANLEYQHALEQLELRTLRSPFDGVVVERMLNPGDLAESGTDRKPILKLAQVDPLRVEVVLPEEAYGKLSVGMKGVVIPDILGGQYEAHVTVVDPVLDAASGTLGVRLELPNHEGQLPGGLRCRVEFPDLRLANPRQASRP